MALEIQTCLRISRRRIGVIRGGGEHSRAHVSSSGSTWTPFPSCCPGVRDVQVDRHWRRRAGGRYTSSLRLFSLQPAAPRAEWRNERPCPTVLPFPLAEDIHLSRSIDVLNPEASTRNECPLFGGNGGWWGDFDPIEDFASAREILSLVDGAISNYPHHRAEASEKPRALPLNNLKWPLGQPRPTSRR